MSNHRPGTKGYLEKSEDKKGVTFYVGAKDLSDKEHPYHGPVARVDWDDTWLNITTDDYEGHAMLNIEALPYLRRALAQIDRAIKAKARAVPNGERA